MQEFVELALEREYDEFDSRYYNCSPDLTYYLEKYLETNINEFITIVQ